MKTAWPSVSNIYQQTVNVDLKLKEEESQNSVHLSWSDAFDDSFATYLAKFVDRVPRIEFWEISQ